MNQDYRPCVGVMVLNKAGQVLIGRRKNKRQVEHVAPNFEWQMPQGGIDEGEQPYAAALRELYEETNISSVELLAESPEWYSYDLPVDNVRKVWRGRYKGQIQRWFAFRFTGPVSEIDIDHPAGGAAKPEFDAYRWENIDRLVDLIIPFKRPVYEKVVADFAHLTKDESVSG